MADEGVRLSADQTADAIRVSLSVPDSLEYHAVEDGELERLMKMEKPVWLGVAIAAVAIAASLLPQVIPVIGKIYGGGALLGADAIYLAICSSAIVLAAAAGIIGVTGKSEAQRALEAIRERPKVTLPAGHPAAPA